MRKLILLMLFASACSIAADRNVNSYSIATDENVEYQLNSCIEQSSDSSFQPNYVDAIWQVAGYFNEKDGKDPDFSTASVKLLVPPQHGKMTYRTDTSYPMYQYDVETNYVGNDLAEFLVQYRGKTYRVIIDLHVMLVAGEGDNYIGSCKKANLIPMKNSNLNAQKKTDA